MRSVNIHLDSVARRRAMLIFYTLLLFAVGLMVLIIVLVWSSSKHDDRLAVIANFLAGGTLLLALLAGFVALQAYAAATGPPDLKFSIENSRSASTELVFLLERWAQGEIASGPPDSSVSIFVANSSKYSASNPAVILRLRDAAIHGEMYADTGVWTVIDWQEDKEARELTAFQWDGGPTYSVHGKSTRRLPMINLQGLHPAGENP